jgi:hypothetical protein
LVPGFNWHNFCPSRDKSIHCSKPNPEQLAWLHKPAVAQRLQMHASMPTTSTVCMSASQMSLPNSRIAPMSYNSRRPKSFLVVRHVILVCVEIVVVGKFRDLHQLLWVTECHSLRFTDIHKWTVVKSMSTMGMSFTDIGCVFANSQVCSKPCGSGRR